MVTLAPLPPLQVNPARHPVALAVRLRQHTGGAACREELTFTEDLGTDGARVPTTLPARVGEVLELEGVDGPLKARARVLVHAVGPAGVDHLDLEFLGTDCIGDVREVLRRAGVLVPAPRPVAPPVSSPVTAHVPPGVRDRDGIVEAIRGAFRDVAGTWVVEIEVVSAFQPPWWLATVRSHGEIIRMSFRHTEQNPPFVGEALREALRRRKLVS